MVNTSTRPVTVDGVRLDTLAWNIEKIDRATASRRNGDYSTPLMDGSVAGLNDALEPSIFGLQMWLRGTDADGAVPVNGQTTTLRENLDELLHLFGKRHALIDLREKVDGIGGERRCWAKVTEAIAPDINTAGSAAVFSVALTIPAGMWEEPDQRDWTQVAPITAAEVTTMQGSTERINDGVFLVKGPANTPRVMDPSTGMYVELGQNLAAGSYWRFSSGTWASRVGTGLTLGSMDTDGTDVSGVTGCGGPSRAYGLPLVPTRDTGARRVTVTLTAASGIVNGTTQLSVRARRKYAA